MFNKKMIVKMIIISIVAFAPVDALLAATIWVPDDYSTIQAAINAASAGDTIKVEEGTYTLTSDIDVTISVTIEGGYDSNHDRDWKNNETIIDGNDSVRCLDISANATIDGFTLIDGYTTGDGGGIENSATSTIKNCIIRNCRGDDGGGIYHYSGTLTVENCVFFENDADDDGGGLHCDDTTVILRNCVFWENDAAEDGGGIYFYDVGTAPTISNCTIYENDADGGDGGGVCNKGDSNPSFINCIVWDSYADGSGHDVYNSAGSSPYWGWSDIEDCGGSGGGWDTDYGIDAGGNIDDEPGCLDDGNGDGDDDIWATCDDGLSLTSTSPCVDTGLNTAGDLDYDLCGKDRRIDGDQDNTITIDMGAYEYDPN